MSDERSNRALARIEAALDRLQTRASQPAGTGDEAELAELQARHAKLRAAVTESLEQLDQLIESAQG